MKERREIYGVDVGGKRGPAHLLAAGGLLVKRAGKSRLILIRIQDSINDPVPSGNAPYAFMIFLHTGEAVHEMDFQCRYGSEYMVREGFLPKVVPEVFDGIEFGRIGRERKKVHVVRDAEILRRVPACAVHDHDDEFLGMADADLFEEEAHHRRVDRREDEGVEDAVGRRNSGIGVGELLNYRGVNERPTGEGSPTTPGIADPSESCFVVKHDTQGSAFGFRHDFFRPDDLGEFFLNSSWARGSVLGWRLSGASFLHPCRASRR